MAYMTTRWYACSELLGNCGRPVEEFSSTGEVYVGTWPRSSCKSPWATRGRKYSTNACTGTREEVYTLGRDSCMFQVTIRILRKPWCSGGACGWEVDEGLFASEEERELCGRRVCRRVNRAVQSV